jgi:hypothetical protein
MVGMGDHWAGDYSFTANAGYQLLGEIYENAFFGWAFHAVYISLSETGMLIREWVRVGQAGQMAMCPADDPSALTYSALLAYAQAEGGMSPEEAAAWVRSGCTRMMVGFQGGAPETLMDQTHISRVRIYERNTIPTLEELTTISNMAEADPTAWADYELRWNNGPDLTDRSGNHRDLVLEQNAILYEGRTLFDNENTQTVSFGTDGATSGSAPNQVSIVAGDGLVLPDAGTLIRTGYELIGWKEEPGDFSPPAQG